MRGGHRCQRIGRLSLFAALACVLRSFATGEAVAKTPPMGWNSWNSFGCGQEMNADTVKAVADKMVTSGLAAAGYECKAPPATHAPDVPACGPLNLSTI